jgi:hypothetical protein
MIRAFQLLISPAATWEKIAEGRHSVIFILATFILPLLLLVSVCEGFGLTHWGRQQNEFGRPTKINLSSAVVYEASQAVIGIVVIFLAAFLVKIIGETFHGRHKFEEAYAVVAYGLSPFFLVRLFDTFSIVPWWLTWPVGVLLALSTLYYGIPHVMRPDPAHALGLYFISALTLMIITGLARYVGHLILQHQLQATFASVVNALSAC